MVVGTGANGALPVMKDVKLEAKRRNVELVIVPTAKAVQTLNEKPEKTNAILHSDMLVRSSSSEACLRHHTRRSGEPSERSSLGDVRREQLRQAVRTQWRHYETV